MNEPLKVGQRNCLTAGVIGHTGRGDFGHELDLAFQGLINVECVAIADPNLEGLEKTGRRTGAERLYEDYQQMLSEEDLDLVSVAPRWVDCHAEMVIAAAEAGVKGILCEKPMARTLKEADAMIKACDHSGARLVIAHRRINAYELHAKELVEEGRIGDIQVIRGHGKADHRSGGLDLMVLGTHILDSMRFFAEDEVAWASGHVTQDGVEISLDDIRDGDEQVGLIAGNGVAAYYAFKNGITAHYESYRGNIANVSSSRWFGFEVYGTEGIISLRNSPSGELYIYPKGLWIPNDSEWSRVIIEDWDKNVDGTPRTPQEHMWLSNRMIVKELIRALGTDSEIVNASSGRDGRAALEMVMAVHESQKIKGRVGFPMENRDNPYNP